MAAFADVGVDFVQDFLLGRSKTVNDLSDLLKERSVLRRQSRDTNRNIRKVGVLPIWIAKSNVSSIGPSSEDLRHYIICV